MAMSIMDLRIAKSSDVLNILNCPDYFVLSALLSIGSFQVDRLNPLSYFFV